MVVSERHRACGVTRGMMEWACARCGGGVQQDVTVLQVLDIGTVLEVFLERVAALDRGDGALVHVDRCVLVGYGGHDDNEVKVLEYVGCGW
jgi:hypothetical protein